MSVLARNNVLVSGKADGQPMLFAHGFGCDQNMWRFVVPAFEGAYKTIAFDHVGHGNSDASSYTPERYESLHGYARDVLEIIEELELREVVFVGHSVSAMIGALAALVMVGPSPRYIDDEAYVGGFSRSDIDGLVDSLESNYLGWSTQMAPVIMGNAERPELGSELTASFCRTDPAIARQFARVTFLSDNRADLARIDIPTLVLQCSDDIIAPTAVGRFVHEQIPRSTFMMLNATGHCPNLSAPEETVAAIETFLRR